ncbi:hypothetical protein DXT99_24320 [Pontibacter diazotrophicus]|uniref:Uncharacterized protein n=1 Tax=Pontibacter diazotrophicus TaxID=1400979 RepID=A0A3D8L2H1_9BACT|nr:hypothetical protein [Pontibacter diazotrophicus]RDV11533.1 hypothetical protein DXT99_24320 [Pontibacter diazotrophicus]
MEVRTVRSDAKKAVKVMLPLVLLLLFGALPGYGQISHKAQEKHGREMRKSLKEAAKADIAYKESHLNTNAYTFRKGAAARRQIKQDERASYQFNERGKPMRWFHFLKKKKYKREQKKN